LTPEPPDEVHHTSSLEHIEMNALFARISPVVAAATLAIVGTATAADVNMTGWQTWGGIAATANSSTTISVPAGSTGVSALSFTNLNFTSINGSWQSEFVIRVEVPGSTTAFWSIKPSATQASGTFTGSGSGTTFGGGAFVIPAGTTSLKVFDSTVGSVRTSTILLNEERILSKPRHLGFDHIVNAIRKTE
jgi:hypothetical protein